MLKTWKQRGDFRKGEKASVDNWYDIYEDWDLIVSSFAMQYQVREEEIARMEWREFCTLLSGIMPKTPLGMVVQVRSEEDKDILKHFTPSQKRIRNAWRNHHSPVSEMNEDEKRESMLNFQEVIAKAFG